MYTIAFTCCSACAVCLHAQTVHTNKYTNSQTQQRNKQQTKANKTETEKPFFKIKQRIQG